MNTILCFGDSITNGARNEFHRNYPMELSQIIQDTTGQYVHCINKGINNETTSHMLDRAYDVIKAYREANIMLFLGGTNDSKIPVPGDIFRNNVESILMLANSFSLKPFVGLIPMISGTCLPCFSQEKGNESIKEYNEILLTICEKSNIVYTDFRNISSEYFCDGIHLNYAGDKKMAAIWYETIKREL